MSISSTATGVKFDVPQETRIIERSNRYFFQNGFLTVFDSFLLGLDTTVIIQLEIGNYIPFF